MERKYYQKINEANAAILFISNDALKPESPIRTLELPLIAKRIRDENDNFIFFPIFLEEVDKEKLENYEFTIDGTNEKVNFLEFFQVLELQNKTSLKKPEEELEIIFFEILMETFQHHLKVKVYFLMYLKFQGLDKNKEHKMLE